MNAPKITVFVTHFGKMEPWIPLFLETMAYNPDIMFIFISNLDVPQSLKDRSSVFALKLDSMDAFGRWLQHQLPFDIKIDLSNPYKMCDFKPLIPTVFKNMLGNTDFYGWCDTDILMGNIRKFYTRAILEAHEVFTTHTDRISGHFTLFKATQKNLLAYRQIPDWKDKLENPTHLGIDECQLMKAYQKIHDMDVIYNVEQYSTPLTSIPWIDGQTYFSQPTNWQYRDAVITNDTDTYREFMYLHLMNFKSDRYTYKNSPAPWSLLTNPVTATPEYLKTGIRISKDGIHKI